MTAAQVFRIGRLLSAVVLVIAAGYHVWHVARGQGEMGRHLLFVAINGGLAALLVWRPRWAFWPSLAIGIQQLASHGLDLSSSFLGTAPLDTLSLAVCLFFPTLVTILYLERQE